MERMMKVQEVILKAMAGSLKWWEAAEIIGVSDRTMRRWRERYQDNGYDDYPININNLAAASRAIEAGQRSGSSAAEPARGLLPVGPKPWLSGSVEEMIRGPKPA